MIDSQAVIMKSIFIFYLLSRYKDSASVPGNECCLALSLPHLGLKVCVAMCGCVNTTLLKPIPGACSCCTPRWLQNFLTLICIHAVCVNNRVQGISITAASSAAQQLPPVAAARLGHSLDPSPEMEDASASQPLLPQSSGQEAKDGSLQAGFQGAFSP